ncbi:MAG: hypothetical protein AAF993_05370 [Pseudomonadota bacterium]
MSEPVGRPPQNKLPPLYSLTAMGIATFLGSALAAGYMLASNYAALGQHRAGQFAMGGSVVFMLLLMFIPASWATGVQAQILLMFTQVAAVLLVANKLQGPMFATYEEMGGQYYSNWRGVLVGFATFGVLLIAVMLIFAITGVPQPAA